MNALVSAPSSDGDCHMWSSRSLWRLWVHCMLLHVHKCESISCSMGSDQIEIQGQFQNPGWEKWCFYGSKIECSVCFRPPNSGRKKTKVSLIFTVDSAALFIPYYRHIIVITTVKITLNVLWNKSTLNCKITENVKKKRSEWLFYSSIYCSNCQ